MSLPNKHRLLGLEGIRGVLALCVVIFHVGMPPVLIGYDESSFVLRKVNALYHWMINGQFAVVAFFFVSGLCIHYPYVSRKLGLSEFFVRRYLRLSVPASVAIALTWLVGMRDIYVFNGVPVWSLWCELAYYTMYPLVYLALKYLRWRWILIGTFTLAFFVLLVSESHPMYHEYGIIRTTVIGFPVWLMGACFAETVEVGTKTRKYNAINLWSVRFAMLVASGLSLMLAYLGIIGLGWSLTVVSPLIYWWNREEISFAEQKGELKVMTFFGQISYSLYLTHMLVLYLSKKLGLSQVGHLLEWLFTLLLILLGAWLFYVVVERPSHSMSRRLGKMCRN